MALASALLKRLFVSKTLGVPWTDITFSRKRDAQHGKPCYAPADGSNPELEFNVSHQAGIVVLVGCAAADVELGVDVVCVNERDDYAGIDREGFDVWVDTYKEFFSPAEMWDMKYCVDAVQLRDGTLVSAEELGRNDWCCARGQVLTAKLKSGREVVFDSDLLIAAKLRRFYAFFCYKEAYIKMTGEAMLASWLRRLEFSNVRSPTPRVGPSGSAAGVWGERVDGVDVSLESKVVDYVKLEIQAYEDDFMVAIAARPRSKLTADGFPQFERILWGDISEFAAGAT